MNSSNRRGNSLCTSPKSTLRALTSSGKGCQDWQQDEAILPLSPNKQVCNPEYVTVLTYCLKQLFVLLFVEGLWSSFFVSTSPTCRRSGPENRAQFPQSRCIKDLGHVPRNWCTILPFYWINCEGKHCRRATISIKDVTRKPKNLLPLLRRIEAFENVRVLRLGKVGGVGSCIFFKLQRKPQRLLY